MKVNKKQVKLAKKAISEMGLRKIKNINRSISAYGLKHLLEEHLMIGANGHHNYISEQACIKAMIKLGFDSHMDKYNKTYFNVGSREMIQVKQDARRAMRTTVSQLSLIP